MQSRVQTIYKNINLCPNTQAERRKWNYLAISYQGVVIELLFCDQSFRDGNNLFPPSYQALSSFSFPITNPSSHVNGHTYPHSAPFQYYISVLHLTFIMSSYRLVLPQNEPENYRTPQNCSIAHHLHVACTASCRHIVQLWEYCQSYQTTGYDACGCTLTMGHHCEPCYL